MSDMPIERFVDEALALSGASRSPIGSRPGIWRAELPLPVARYLGRDTADLLYTFDPKLWEPGARLECLHSQSAIVARLGSYALARGSVAAAYRPATGPNCVYSAYLAARFRTATRGFCIADRAGWLAANMESSAPVVLRGEPLDLPDLVEGAPPGISLPDSTAIQAALAALSERWNSDAAEHMDKMHRSARKQFADEAAEIASCSSPDIRERAMKRLSERTRIVAECSVEMALLLWLPTR